jgi:hypothetical protein
LTVYSSNVSTAEGIYPGMLMTRLITIKGLDTDNNGRLVLNGYSIGFDLSELTAYGDKTHQEAYMKGVSWKPTAACFKEGATVKYISF